jgi:hypothetical protein
MLVTAAEIDDQDLTKDLPPTSLFGDEATTNRTNDWTKLFAISKYFVFSEQSHLV